MLSKILFEILWVPFGSKKQRVILEAHCVARLSSSLELLSIFLHTHFLFQRDFLWLFCTYWTFLWAFKLHPFDYFKDLEQEIEWFCMEELLLPLLIQNNKRFFNDDSSSSSLKISQFVFSFLKSTDATKKRRGHLFNFLDETFMEMWPLHS